MRVMKKGGWVAALPAGQHYPDRASLGRCDDSELTALVQSLPRGNYLRETACEELVRRYDFLVHNAAMRYSNSPEPVEDLTQAGYIGLLKAINNFDATLGPGLTAYAIPCITGEIKRHFRDKRWQVHVRRSAQELRSGMAKARDELTQRLSRIPTDQEIGEHLGLDTGQLHEAHRAQAAFQAVSLDAPLSADPDACTRGDLLASEDTQLETCLGMDAVWAHLPELPPREQHLLAMRFYGNMTQSQIGHELGLSQMHVSRLLTHALTYLRNRILGSDPPPPIADRPAEPLPTGPSRDS
jgi:RNA polymerase sigma-B factor